MEKRRSAVVTVHHQPVICLPISRTSGLRDVSSHSLPATLENFITELSVLKRERTLLGGVNKNRRIERASGRRDVGCDEISHFRQPQCLRSRLPFSASVRFSAAVPLAPTQWDSIELPRLF